MNKAIEQRFSACRLALGETMWEKIVTLSRDTPERLHKSLVSLEGVPPYAADLALLEWEYEKVKNSDVPKRDNMTGPEVNPTLRLLELSWKNLPALLLSEDGCAGSSPEKGKERVLVWKRPTSGAISVRTATEEDLLVLKMIVEGIVPEKAAQVGGIAVGAVDNAMVRAAERGLILTPPSLLRRDPDVFTVKKVSDENFISTDVFALQWHITQACDLHCLHCYDRSDRKPMPFEKAVSVLDNLRTFCKGRNVSGHVSFSGGNPVLYPHFNELYRYAVELGFSIGILGNPISRIRLEEILDIAMPSFFQVSLEGLENENDRIRGQGHYRRTLEFLNILRELNIYSMVMVTLTEDNIDEIIPLAFELEGLAKSFNFNRLSMVGEGAKLSLPEREQFISFLEQYLEASEKHPHMRLKDNLFNILLSARGKELFDGCTGYGCGAAFNFITVLSDGEAHACRKFPSPIGNVFQEGIEGVYDSEAANRYRLGCDACRGCPIRIVCGGCLSISHSFGLDVFRERDPFCFIGEV